MLINLLKTKIRIQKCPKKQSVGQCAIRMMDTKTIVINLHELASKIYGAEFDDISSEKDIAVSLIDEAAKRLSCTESLYNLQKSAYRQRIFRAICPDAPLNDGVVNICPKKVDRNYSHLCVSNGKECRECKKEYWFEKVTL